MQNKKAKYEYEFLDTFEAGVMLTGPEVKAVRDNRMAFNDAYCAFKDDELFLLKFHISVKDGGDNEFLRDRKLLLTRKELGKLQREVKENGLTIVPTGIFFTKTGLVKLGIALARGKKVYDKRESIKKRDLARNSE